MVSAEIISMLGKVMVSARVGRPRLYEVREQAHGQHQQSHGQIHGRKVLPIAILNESAPMLTSLKYSAIMTIFSIPLRTNNATCPMRHEAISKFFVSSSDASSPNTHPKSPQH